MSEKTSDNIGATIGIILICILLLCPWYLWHQESQARNKLLKEYSTVKKEIKDINKLTDTIDELIEENEMLAKSENKYINLYCSSISFSSAECKNFILETQKAIIKTENKTQEYLEKDPLGILNKKNGTKTTKNGTKYKVLDDDNEGWAF